MAPIFRPGEMLVGIGEALWDMLPDGKKIGGAPANFAYHCAQAGLESCVISAIGNDRLGEELVSQFDDKQLRYALEVVDYPTGTVGVQLDERGVPQYEIKEGVAWDNIPLTARIEEIAKKTRAVCFGSLAQRSHVSRETLNSFMNIMQAQDDDRYFVFDVNLRQNFYTTEVIHESLERANVLKINDEEIVVVSRMFGWPGIDLKDKCWILLGKYNLDILVLTCGVNGSYVFTPGHVSFLPTPVVEVVDTVGAGDAFSAIFMASYLQGITIEAAHSNAVAWSAYVCTRPGAMPVVPEELKLQIKNSPRRL
ncbi:MAG: carbohydrate kinase [Desulfovibrio sp.]|nr:carbohydrate kinase [Desulfovibrio sp.]